MDHNIASETYAAERYLLGEMSAEERSDFEEHFAGCRVCGEDVHVGSVFIANAKALFREESRQASPTKKKARQWRELLKRDWNAWFRLPVTIPALSALALAAVAGYQNLVLIPDLRAPRSLNSPFIFAGDTGGPPPHEPEDIPLRFQLLLSAPTDSPRIAVNIVDAQGRMVRGGFVESPGLNRMVDVFFPDRLAPGAYTMIVLTDQGGKPGVELGRGQFEITRSYTAN